MNCPFISTFKIGEGCDITFCHHNVFWNKLNLPPEAHPTETSLLFSNCMCLLDRELTLEEIGEIWGITRERIRQIERDATIKLLSLPRKRNVFLKELGFKEDSINERLACLKAKKNRTGKIDG